MQEQQTGVNGAACPVCGEPVPPQTGRGQPRRYCSSRCKSAAARRRREQIVKQPLAASHSSRDAQPVQLRRLSRQEAIGLVASDPAALVEALTRARAMITSPVGRASGWYEVAIALKGLVASFPGDID